MADASTIGILRVLLQADKGEFSPVMRAAITELVKFGDESKKTEKKTKEAAGGLKGFSDALRPIVGGLNDVGVAANPLTRTLSNLQGAASGVASGVGALGPAGVAAAVGLGALTAGGIAAVAIIGTVGAELIDLTKHAANAGDELFTLSNKTGLSVEALSEFQFVAQQTDTSVDSIVASISRLGENLSKGSKETAKAISAIGLSIDDIRKQSPDQAFKTIIAALGQIPDAGKRSAAGVAIFGKQFRQIAQLTQEDFDGLNKKAREWGLVFGSEFAAAGDRFNDAMGLIGMAVQAVQNRIGAEFLPVATAFVETFGDHFIAALQVASSGTAGFGNAVSSMTVAVGQAVADMVAAVTPLVAKLASFFVDTFSGLLSWIAKTQSALGGLASHIPVLHDVGVAMLESSKALQAAGVTGADAADKLKTKINVYAEAITEAAKRTSTGLPQAVKTVQRELAEQARRMDEARKAAGTFGASLDDLAGNQKGAAKEAEAHRKELERLDDLLAKRGVLSVGGYSKALGELVEVLNLAARAGTPALQKALAALGPEFDKLRKNAADSGQDVAALNSILDQFLQKSGLADLAADTIAWERANVAAAGSLDDLMRTLPQVSVATEDAALQTTILTDAYHELGMKTPAELQKAADAATRAYQQIVASGTATADQVRQAHEKMVDAVNAATGKIPSYWETTIFPRVKNVVETLQTAVSGSFAQMLLGAKSFKDGFVDIWHSIKQSILNILNSILDAFINSFLKGILNAMAGQQGAFSKAFGGLLNFGGGGTGIPGTGGLLGKLLGKIPGLGVLGGGVALAGAPGTVTAGIPSMAGVGTTVPVGGIPGSAAGAGAGATAGALALSGGAGFGLGALGQHWFGRGAGAGAFGAGTGAAAGAAIAAALAPATMGLSLAIGAISGWLGGIIKFGPSKEERQARQMTGALKEQTFAGLSETQRQGAMNAGWSDPKAAGLLIAVRDAYLAVGKSAADAEKDVKAMWDAEVKGPEATQEAMVPILAALDEYKKKTGDAAAADAAHQQVIAAKTAEYQKQADTIREQMKGLDDELARINATERPEKHMGTREKMARERIAKEKAALDKQLDDLQAKIDAVNTTQPQEQFREMATVGQQAASDVADKFGEIPPAAGAAAAGVAEQFGQMPGAVGGSAGQTVEEFRSRFGLMPGIAGDAVGGVFEKFGALPSRIDGVAGAAVDEAIGQFARLPGAASGIADDVNDEFRTIGHGLSPIILKYRFKQEGEGLPDLPGHALGGVFTRPHVAAIAEGGEAEIVGSVGFMTRALEGAIGRVGQASGGGTKVFVVPVMGQPSDADVDRLIDTLRRAEPRIAGNDAGVRTAVRAAIGIR